MIKLLFFFFIIPLGGQAKFYQIGAQWNRKLVVSLPQYKHIAESIATIGHNSTAFYIGIKNNRHLLVTNMHVCPNEQKCLNRSINFYYKRNSQHRTIQAKMKRIILREPSLDLSILEIVFENVSNNNDVPTPLKFSQYQPREYQPLITLGFGINLNEHGSLTIDDSYDCRVFSKNNDLRYINDPDQNNPLTYPVLSFIMGCDASHGDSGSPVIDKLTGEVLGLLWTGKTPKDPLTSSKDFYKMPYEMMWRELNFASPAFKITEMLESI